MIEDKNIIDSAACPSCGEKKMKNLFPADTSHLIFKIIQCTRCGLCRTSPFPADEILRIHDMPVYYGSRENKFIPFIQNIRDSIMQARAGHYLSMLSGIEETPKILDIGCSEGRLLKSFLKYNCKCFGVEHPAYPSDRFIDADRIEYLQGDLECLDLEDNSFDLIFLWHVLEHMDNPSRVLEQVYDLLAPGGFVILTVPNFSSIEAKIFKQSWFHLDVPWHRFHFTGRSIEYLIKKNRFKIAGYSTLCLEQGPYGITQSMLNLLKFPHNSLYEALKGDTGKKNSVLFIPQVLLAVLLFLPALAASFAASLNNRGGVLKLILKK